METSIRDLEEKIKTLEEEKKEEKKKAEEEKRKLLEEKNDLERKLNETTELREVRAYNYIEFELVCGSFDFGVQSVSMCLV